VNRIAAVLIALLVAVHVSIPAVGMAAPLPVFFAFGLVIAGMCCLIWRTAGVRIHWGAAA
jgi:hypothetical protein